MTTNEKDVYLLTGVEIKMYDPSSGNLVDSVSEETKQE